MTVEPFVVEMFVVEPYDAEVVDAEVVPDPAPAGESPPAAGVAIQIVDRSTGQLVPILSAEVLLAASGLADLSAATDADLGNFHRLAVEAISVIGEAKGIADGVVIGRMDLDHDWTRRVPGIGKLKSASPTAGTVVYDTGELVAACTDLVAREKIGQGAMDNALERAEATLTIEYALLHQIAAALAGDLTAAALEILTATLQQKLSGEPKPRYTQKRAGIDKLLTKSEDPDVVAAIKACQRPATPPPRKVTLIPARPGGD